MCECMNKYIKFTIPSFCDSKPGIVLKRAPKLDRRSREGVQRKSEISLCQKLKILPNLWRIRYQIDTDRPLVVYFRCYSV